MQFSKRLIYAGLVGALWTTAAVSDGGYLRTSPPLDDPRGYCLDVAGRGADARPDEPLRFHTCKYGEDNIDQIFRWVDERSGHMEMPAYDRCLAAASADSGAEVFVMECEDSDLQAWNFVPNGNLSLRARPDLCLTTGEEVRIAGSAPMMYPGYAWRSSTMEPCRDRGDPYQDFRWGRDDEHVAGNAAGLRSGMPESIASGIRALPAALSGEILAQTSALYENEPYTFKTAEVERSVDIPYGDDERQVLDVHVDTHRRDQGPQPVVMFFHGGGYVRGSKEGSHNVADYFASFGLVGVSATYRLAPDHPWPAGARDVAGAVAWVRENIAEFGGDPNRIFVIGKSAGAGHVATYAFRPEVLGGEAPAAAGIILISGGYSNDAENPSDNNIAYFGSDVVSWGDKQILGNVSRSSIPALLTTAEYDPRDMINSSLLLATELAADHGASPRVRQLQGHNHYSTNMSIGTPDRMLSDEILDFVMTTGGG